MIREFAKWKQKEILDRKKEELVQIRLFLQWRRRVISLIETGEIKKGKIGKILKIRQSIICKILVKFFYKVMKLSKIFNCNI